MGLRLALYDNRARTVAIVVDEDLARALVAALQCCESSESLSALTELGRAISLTMPQEEEPSADEGTGKAGA